MNTMIAKPLRMTSIIGVCIGVGVWAAAVSAVAGDALGGRSADFCQEPDQAIHDGMAVVRVDDVLLPTRAADRFMLDSTQPIEGVRWWGTYLGIPIGTCDLVDNFKIRFYLDNAGLPGTQVGSYTIGAASQKQLTGLTIYDPYSHLDLPEYEYMATLSPAFTATGGQTYWIEIANSGKTTSPYCLWQWELAPPGDAYSLWDQGAGGWQVSDAIDADLAVCLLTGAVQEACCFADYSCQDLDPSNCTVAGGLPFGPGTSCATVDCDVQACCNLYNNACYDEDPDDCLSSGYIPLGLGTTCATAECPIVCCLPDGTCQEILESECTLAGGDTLAWQVGCVDSECPQACCEDYGNCRANVWPSRCIDYYGGQPMGAGSTCGAVECVEACCFGDGSCQVMTPDDCWWQDGIPRGAGTTCEADMCNGACCSGSGSCQLMSGADCAAQGSYFMGVDTTCSSGTCYQACCLLDLDCESMYPNDCRALNGVPLGPGTYCTSSACDYQACCLGGGYCSNYTPSYCLDLGGMPGGYGSRCDKDCNLNGIADVCDVGEELAADCNHNWIPDECDISQGTSPDVNGNGIPDECDDQCLTAHGDANGDCRIDLADRLIFVNECYSGAGVPYLPGCECLDFDLDDDIDDDDLGAFNAVYSVDIRDFVNFQQCYAPPGPPGSECEDFDYDLNGAVDADDWVEFEARLELQEIPGCCPDCWETGFAANATMYVFDPNNPVPLGFFGEHALTFSGEVQLIGVSDGSHGSGADTCVQHQSLTFDNEPFEFVHATVKNLKLSTQKPIVVAWDGPSLGDCNHNGIDDQTDITSGYSADDNGDLVPDECQSFIGAVRLSETPAPLGYIAAYKESPYGGLADIVVYVNPIFTFVSVMDMERLKTGAIPVEDVEILMLDGPSFGIDPLELSFRTPFALDVPAGSDMFVPACSQGFVPGVSTRDPYEVCDDYQSTPSHWIGSRGSRGVGIPDPCVTGFPRRRPWERGGTNPPANTTCTSHISPGEAHYICPPACCPARRCAYFLQNYVCYGCGDDPNLWPAPPLRIEKGACGVRSVLIEGPATAGSYVGLAMFDICAPEDCDVEISAECQIFTQLVTSDRVYTTAGTTAAEVALELAASINANVVDPNSILAWSDGDILNIQGGNATLRPTFVIFDSNSSVDPDCTDSVRLGKVLGGGAQCVINSGTGLRFTELPDPADNSCPQNEVYPYSCQQTGGNCIAFFFFPWCDAPPAPDCD